MAVVSMLLTMLNIRQSMARDLIIKKSLKQRVDQVYRCTFNLRACRYESYEKSFLNLDYFGCLFKRKTLTYDFISYLRTAHQNHINPCLSLIITNIGEDLLHFIFFSFVIVYVCCLSLTVYYDVCDHVFVYLIFSHNLKCVFLALKAFFMSTYSWQRWCKSLC